ncbi:PH domain-containing protein, partial [Spinactinospora alkalitolerans]|uniref:PH domain-containing protein n=1 Tax=Spinactinospora alkalitolerans TaxID=687207 RepID=UPI0031D53A99
MWQLWGHDGTLVVEDNGDLVFVFGPQADPAKARFGHRRFPRGVIAWAETVDGGWLAKPYFRLHRIGEPRRPDADPSRNSDILLLTGDDQVAAVRPLVAELCADREPPVEQPFDDVVLREDIARAASDADLFLAKRSLRALPEQVTDDETVEFMTSGSHDGDSGLVVVTDRRLLHVSESRMFGSSTLSIPVGQIVSVEMSSAGFGEAAGSLVVHTSSGETAFDVVGDDGLKEITARLRRAPD